VLASAKDHSVVVVQVGFSTNLAHLLASPADSIGPLTGTELIKQKVRLLSVMAGAFTPIKDKPFHEFNVVGDIPSAQKLVEEWPTPIVFSGFEIGASIEYPAESIEHDYAYATHHPLADAYRLYNPPPHNRPTWDLTSVLYAVRPDAGYFELSTPGRVTIADDGSTFMSPSADGPHRYLSATAAQCARARQAFVELASQSPPGESNR
jgi:inosine-uridine nucleoside N-ribohydrolase